MIRNQRILLSLLVMLSTALYVFHTSLVGVLAQGVEERCQVITPDNVGNLDEVFLLKIPVNNGLAWSPSGDVLAISTNAGAFVYDISDLQTPETTEIYGTERVQDVAFSTDGQLIASVEDAIQIYDVLTGDLLFKKDLPDPLLDTFDSIVFQPHSPTVIALTGNGDLWVWNYETDILNVIKHEGFASSGERVAIRPNGSQVAYAVFNTVTIRATSTLTEVTKLGVRGLAVRDIAFDPSSTVVVVVEDGGLILFLDTETYTEVASARANRSAASVAYSPDGALIALGSADQIRLADPRDLTSINTPLVMIRFRGEEAGNRIYVEFSPDGRLLALANWVDGFVRVYGVCS